MVEVGGTHLLTHGCALTSGLGTRGEVLALKLRDSERNDSFFRLGRDSELGGTMFGVFGRLAGRGSHLNQTYSRTKNIAQDRLFRRRCASPPWRQPRGKLMFSESTPTQMLPPGGSICGRLTEDLPLGCLQGGRRIRGAARGGHSPTFVSHKVLIEWF